MHPFNIDLTSTILRPIISKLQEHCPQIGRGTKTGQTPDLSPACQERGLFSRAMQYFHIPPNEVSYLFPFAFFKPQSLLDLHGPVLYLIYSFWVPSLYLIPFPPPPNLGGGTYAIIVRCSHRQFCTCNLHTWILLVKTLVRRSEHAYVTMLDTWTIGQ